METCEIVIEKKTFDLLFLCIQCMWATTSAHIKKNGREIRQTARQNLRHCQDSYTCCPTVKPVRICTRNIGRDRWSHWNFI